jgi:hypothetical protein
VRASCVHGWVGGATVTSGVSLTGAPALLPALFTKRLEGEFSEVRK